MKLTRQLRIHGRVQGVWYRESMRQQAQRLGVTGWVRNRSDGTVEAVVQGAAGAVEAMIEWARQGPPSAKVERVDIADSDGDYPIFDKKATL